MVREGTQNIANNKTFCKPGIGVIRGCTSPGNRAIEIDNPGNQLPIIVHGETLAQPRTGNAPGVAKLHISDKVVELMGEPSLYSKESIKY